MEQNNTEQWIADNVERLRLVAAPDEEGALVMAFCDENREIVMCSIVDDAMAYLDDRLTRGLTTVIKGSGAAHVVLAVRRRGGQPTPMDRQLWSDLVVLLEGDPVLQDLIVLDDVSHWSAVAA